MRQRRVARAEHQCCCKAGACGGDQVEVRAGAPDKATLLVLERHASCESDEVQMSYEHGSTRFAADVFFCHLIYEALLPLEVQATSWEPPNTRQHELPSHHRIIKWPSDRHQK